MPVVLNIGRLLYMGHARNHLEYFTRKQGDVAMCAQGWHGGAGSCMRSKAKCASILSGHERRCCSWCQIKEARFLNVPCRHGADELASLLHDSSWSTYFLPVPVGRGKSLLNLYHSPCCPTNKAFISLVSCERTTTPFLLRLGATMIDLWGGVRRPWIFTCDPGGYGLVGQRVLGVS